MDACSEIASPRTDVAFLGKVEGTSVHTSGSGHIALSFQHRSRASHSSINSVRPQPSYQRPVPPSVGKVCTYFPPRAGWFHRYGPIDNPTSKR